MSYTQVPTYTTNQLITASHANTYWRDNINALWPFTNAGDIAFASDADDLVRLAIGAAGSMLKVNAGATAPEWLGLGTAGSILKADATSPAWLGIGSAGQVLRVNSAGTSPEWGAGGIKLYTFTRTGELTTTSKTYVDITNASVDVDVILTSSILMITSFSSAIIGSSSNTLVVAANIGGNVVSTIHNTGIGTGDKYKPGALVGWKTGVEAGTVTCKLQWSVGGDTGYIKLIYGAVLVIPE